MADTLPNIVVDADTVVDLYSESGIAVGTQIQIEMIGDGEAKLYSGTTLTAEPTNSDGYQKIYGREQKVNDVAESGAFIWSQHGCTVNVSEF